MHYADCQVYKHSHEMQQTVNGNNTPETRKPTSQQRATNWATGVSWRPPTDRPWDMYVVYPEQVQGKCREQEKKWLFASLADDIWSHYCGGLSQHDSQPQFCFAAASRPRRILAKITGKGSPVIF